MGILNKRSISINGRKTGICLEDPFWSALKEIAGARGTSLSSLVGEIDRSRSAANLSSAARLFVLNYYKDGSRSRNDHK